jgi:hypothetical protein
VRAHGAGRPAGARAWNEGFLMASEALACRVWAGWRARRYGRSLAFG